MLMEVETSYVMPPLSWRSRKAGSTILSKVKSLRTQRAAGISPRIQRPENQEIQCPRAGEYGHPNQEKGV